MPTIEIDSAVFNDVYRPHLTNYARTQIFFGGSSSGKSVFAVGQRTVYDLLSGGRNYLICRQVARTVRASVFQEVVNTINAWGVAHLFDVNRSSAIITCQNGYQILFAGLDDVEKLKSITPAKGAITDIVIEEATETHQNSVKQLYKRQRGGDPNIKKRLTLLFNPILQSNWIFKEYFAPLGWADETTAYNGDDLTILKTWYIHNRFLTSDDIHDLENESDEYFRSVYTFGNWGTLGDVIFRNWEVRDLAKMRAEFINHRLGLDFGYGGDPCGFVRSHYDKPRKTIYIYDELYEKGLTNNVLASELKELCGTWRENEDKKLEFVSTPPITCDTEPKSIAELVRYGINAHSAKKGKDSITYGIQWLQQQRIVVDERCVNTINELQQYQWKKDKDGEDTGQPVDSHNHIIDALRYAYENDALSTWSIF